MISRIVTVIFLLILLLTVGLYAPPGTAPLYVTSPDTGSMEPTITPDDVVIIYGWGDSPSVGDTILFSTSAEEQAVLHRIVDETDGGYITQGDANDITDQQDGFEPVDETDIYGTVIGGDEPITIPYIGMLISNPLAILSLWVIFLIMNLVPENDGRPRTEMVISNSPTILLLFVGVLLAFLPLFTALTAASADVTITTVNTPGQTGTNIVGVGQTGSETVQFVYRNTPITEPFVVTDSGQLVVDSIAQEGEYLTTTIENIPRGDIGVDMGIVSVYTYIGILPDTIIYQLISVHYLLPSVVDGMILSLGLLLLWGVLVSRKKNIRRSRDKIYSMRRRVRRKFK